ncbi:MAG: hypothetical protein II625_00795 [Bacilli bacterium]|nr:hypothetical protein [Bacilli bacterium]
MDDILTTKMYAFIQIIDIIDGVDDVKKRLRPYPYSLPIPTIEVINILSDLQVNGIKFTSRKHDKKTKMAFLRCMRNNMCHNYGNNSFSIKNGKMEFRQHYGENGIEGYIKVSKFNEVMDTLLRRFSKAKGVNYASFTETGIFDNWDAVSLDDIATKTMEEPNRNIAFDTELLFFKILMDRIHTDEDYKYWTDILREEQVYTLNGITLPPEKIVKFFGFIKEHGIQNSKDSVKVYFEKLLRERTLEYQIVNNYNKASTEEERKYNKEALKRIIRARRSRTLSILGELSYYFGQLKTEENNNEFTNNDNMYLISFAGFDAVQFNSPDCRITTYALVDEGSFSNYEKQVVESVRTRRYNMLQRIRNAIMHNYMIQLDYNYDRKEFDVVFRYEESKQIREIRINTTQLSDFIEFIKEYINGRTLQHKRNTHDEFMDYIYSRTSQVDRYEDFYSNNDDLKLSNGFDRGYNFKDNRDVCRFNFDFYLILRRINELDIDAWAYFADELYKIVAENQNPDDRKKNTLPLDKDEFRYAITQIFREMLLYVKEEEAKRKEKWYRVISA